MRTEQLLDADLLTKQLVQAWENNETEWCWRRSLCSGFSRHMWRWFLDDAEIQLCTVGYFATWPIAAQVRLSFSHQMKIDQIRVDLFFAGIFLMNESECEINSSIKAINIHTGEWTVRPWTSVQWLPGNDFLVWLNRWNPLVSNGCSSSFSSSVSGGSWNWVDDGPRNCSSKDGSMAI
jgi:hypothetical protein